MRNDLTDSAAAAVAQAEVHATTRAAVVVPAGALSVVYRDDAIIVVDKPAGLLSVPGRGADKADCAAARVHAQWADALVVHRLDMATSGLLLLARGAAMQRTLSNLWATRQVTKSYEAVVVGLVDADHAVIDLPLSADWPQRPKQKVDRQHGKPSLTQLRVLQRDPLSHTTRVLLQPITGRTHQLRVHLQSIGHPIVGDSLYGHMQATAASSTPTPRLLLHATELALAHPTTQRPWRCVSEAPF